MNYLCSPLSLQKIHLNGLITHFKIRIKELEKYHKCYQLLMKMKKFWVGLSH